MTDSAPLEAAPPGRPRRVLVLGAGGGHRTEASIVRAAGRLGHRARLLDVTGALRRLGPLAPRALLRRADAFAPDTVVLTRYAAGLDDATLTALVRGRSACAWFFDLTEQPHPAIVRLGRAADRLYLTCPSQIPFYLAAGVAEARFLPQAADPAIDRPARWALPWYRCDVSFVGSGPYPYRHTLLAAVARAARLQIRGPGWDTAPPELPVRGGSVRGRAFARVVRGAAISLGAHATAAQRCAPLCVSNRMWKVLGCGGFFLAPRVEGSESLARDGEHCAWFDSTDEAVELVRVWLADPERRAAVARAGREHVLAHHTYAQRVAVMLEGRDYTSS